MSDEPPAPAPPPAGAQPYGPNTPAVRRFLQRLAALGAADWDAAAAAYDAAAGTAALVAADRALARAVEQAGRTAERDAVVGPLVQLLQGAPARPGAGAGAGGPPPDPADAALAQLPAVAEPALAAALALVVRDVLPPRAFDALYAPFAARIPAAALDGPA